MTTSKELSQELWDRGLRLDTYWLWINVTGEWELQFNNPPASEVMHKIPAFQLYEGNGNGLLEIFKMIAEKYEASDNEEMLDMVRGHWDFALFKENPCNYLGQILLYYLHQGYVTIQDGKVV